MMMVPSYPCFAVLRKVDKTGVIYVTDRATAKGYYYGNPEWANFGQGAPEVGALPGAPAREERITLDLPHQEYAPVAGLKELRDAVAQYYNQMYRVGKASQYTAENVCIVPGGRAGLTRLMSTLGLPLNIVIQQTFFCFLSLSPTLSLSLSVRHTVSHTPSPSLPPYPCASLF